MESESSLRRRALGILSDIALHKLVMVSRLLSRDMTAKSRGKFDGVFVNDITAGAHHTTPGGLVYDDRLAGHMARRGWTPQQIDEAVKYGEKIAMVNVTTNTVVTRYIHAVTQQSVVVDSETREVLHLGKPGFKYAARSVPASVSPIGQPPVSGIGPVSDAPLGGSILN